MTNLDTSYTISEVASKLNLNPKTLRRWEDSGKFESSRTLGNQRRYSVEDLQILDAIKHGIIDSQAELLTITQAAALAGVTATTVKRWEDEGKLHPFVTSGKTYYPRPRLLSQLDTLTKPAPELELEPLPSPLPPPPAPPPSPQIPASSPSLETPPPNYLLRSLFLTTLSTILLLTLYHLFFAADPRPATPQLESSTPLQARDSTLALLDSLLDQQGNFTTQGLVTAQRYSLLPSTPPQNPSPGTLYFDTGDNSLRLFTNSTWLNLSSPVEAPSPATVTNHDLLSGLATLQKGSALILVNNKFVTPTTPVIITFTADYSPAKKHWLELGEGSFTLRTDFPVAQASTFTYLILTPQEQTTKALTF